MSLLKLIFAPIIVPAIVLLSVVDEVTHTTMGNDLNAKVSNLINDIEGKPRVYDH